MLGGAGSSPLGIALCMGCPDTAVLDDDDGTPADDDATHGDDDVIPDDDDSSAEPCTHFNAWGRFEIQVSEDGSEFQGIFYDDPSPLLLDALIEEGDCIFFGFEPMPHCEPSCDPPQVCGADDQCHDWPEGIDVGTIELTGTQPPLTLEAGFGNAYYGDQTYPGLVEAGAAVTLTAAGNGEVASFELTARGVAPWDQTLDPLVLRRGQDLPISWTLAAEPDDAQILVHIRADHHAGTSANVTCLTDDAVGTVTVAAPLVDALIDAGAGGLGIYVESAVALRAIADIAAPDAGCAMFFVGADVLVDVRVEP